MRARLLSPGSAFSLESINGESEPREFSEAATVPAGAHNKSRTALRLRAEEDFSASALCDLLATPLPVEDAPYGREFWHRLSKVYVFLVLALAALAIVLWWHVGPMRAVEVAVAVLVVTCPCALGLATPLSYELAQVKLRRLGLFVRSASFLDRALRVRKVIFDKTGTLTLGEPVLDNPGVLEGLGEEDRGALFQLVSRSNHPKSRALLHALERVLLVTPAFDATLEAVEEPGRGLTLQKGGRVYRMGASAFAKEGAVAEGAAIEDRGEEDVVFSADGVPLARFAFREALRHDARQQVTELQRRGLRVYLCSGDAPRRVREMARRLGLSEDDALGGMSPADKEAFVR